MPLGIGRKVCKKAARVNELDPMQSTEEDETWSRIGRMSGLRFPMTSFILWLILLFLCWPLAILALVLYPILWLLLLPFRLIGIAVDGVFGLLKTIILLPATILRNRSVRS